MTSEITILLWWQTILRYLNFEQFQVIMMSYVLHLKFANVR